MRPAPVVLGGDQRRAVGKACPGALGKIGRRFGQHLPLDQNALGRGHAGKGAERRIVGERLWLGPGQGAAKRALALAQGHRNQRIVGGRCGKARPGKADQRAAVFDPLRDRCIALLRQTADIGHDQHGGFLRQQFGNGDSKIRLVRLDQVGIGGERPVDVVERRAAAAATGRGPRRERSATRRRRKPSSSRKVPPAVAAPSMPIAGKIIAQFEGRRDRAAGRTLRPRQRRSRRWRWRGPRVS